MSVPTARSPTPPPTLLSDPLGHRLGVSTRSRYTLGARTMMQYYHGNHMMAGKDSGLVTVLSPQVRTKWSPWRMWLASKGKDV